MRPVTKRRDPEGERETPRDGRLVKTEKFRPFAETKRPQASKLESEQIRPVRQVHLGVDLGGGCGHRLDLCFDRVPLGEPCKPIRVRVSQDR